MRPIVDNRAGNTTDALMWCVIELNMSIVGGSVPSMKPVVREHFPRLLGLSANSGGNQGYMSEDKNHALQLRARDKDGYVGRSTDRVRSHIGALTASTTGAGQGLKSLGTGDDEVKSSWLPVSSITNLELLRVWSMLSRKTKVKSAEACSV